MSLHCHTNIAQTDVDWIGSIPGSGTLQPLKSLFKIVGGSTPRSDVEAYWDGDVVWITPADLGRDGIARLSASQRTITQRGLANCAATVVPPGSIILSTRAPIGSLGVATVPLCTNQGCKALVPGIAVDSDFFAYLLSVAKEALQLRGKGTTFLELSADELGAFKVSVPPLPEQNAITSFLDREAGKIDALVEEQKRLIELLKEKRQAVISHAVTKGLNPDAPMKDSGVEWLGEVPEHWDVLMLKRCFSSVDYGISDSLKPDGAVAVLRMGNIQEGRVEVDDLKYIDQVDEHLLLKTDDLLYNRTNSLDLIGKVGRFVERGSPTTFASYLVRLGISDKCDSAFMTYLLNAEGLLSDARSRALVAIGQCNLNPTRYGEIIVAIPLPSEQRSIVNELDALTSEIDALVAEAHKIIDLLQERRAALISAAVTGKIDVVTGIQRQQPDRARIRMVVSATIIEAIANKPNSGRTKAHKITYLAEVHAGVHELQGTFLREAAGPLDRHLIDDMEDHLQQVNHISVEQLGGWGAPVTYKICGTRGAFRKELSSILGSRDAALDRLITDLKDLDTKHVEAVATLYAVWNDALIDGDSPTDEAVVSGVLNDWHPEKAKKFNATELHTWLGWMRRHKLTPEGRGPRTSTGRLFA